jgi:hypothetical protein
MHTPEEHYASGGILAFAKGDLVDGRYEPYADRVNNEDDSNDSYIPPPTSDDQNQGSQSALDQLNDYILDYLKNKPASAPPPTAKELSNIRAEFLKEQEDYAGPDIHGPAQADQAAREEARKSNMGQMSGLALLQAAGAVLKGRNLAEGASNAAPAYATAMGAAMAADQAEKRSIEQMNFNLADAKRKERMGNFRAANESMENYRKSIADANRAKAESDRADALLAGRAAAANRMPAKGAGAGSGPKLPEQLAAAEIAFGKDPSKENKIIVEGLRRAQAQARSMYSTSNITSDIIPGGPKAQIAGAGIDEKVNAAVATGLDKFKKDASVGIVKDPDMLEYKAAIKAKNMAKARTILEDVAKKIRAEFGVSTAPAAPPPPAPNLRGATSAPRRSPPAGFVPD